MKTRAAESESLLEISPDIALFYSFQNQFYLGRALSHKTEEQEYNNKFRDRQRVYKYGNNEDYAILGHQILEFYFMEYHIQQGFPKEGTKMDKMSSIINIRQQILTEKNLSQIAKYYQLYKFVRTGKQTDLKNNSKVLAECFKSMIAAHYYDKNFEHPALQMILRPVLSKIIGDSGISDAKPPNESSKSKFYELIAKYPRWVPEISSSWQYINQKDGKPQQLQYSMTLKVETQNYKKTGHGFNKRELEELLYRDFIDNLDGIHPAVLESEILEGEFKDEQGGTDHNISLFSNSFNQNLEIDQSSSNLDCSTDDVLSLISEMNKQNPKHNELMKAIFMQ